MWIIIALLGVTSVILMFLPNLARFGMLGAAVTGLLIADQLIPVPIDPAALWVFWVAWIAGVLVTIIPREETPKTFVATTMPSFGAATVGLVIAGLSVVSIALPLPGGGVQNLVAESSLSVEDMPDLTNQVKMKECPPAKGPLYYAYLAEKGTHNMGSAIEVDTVEAGAYRFAVKSFCDPLWLATTKHYVIHGKKLSQTEAQNEARILAKDPAKWAAAIKFVKNKIKAFHLVNAGDVKYDSLGMVPGANPTVMPTLTKFSSQPSLGQALVVELKDGSSRYFRVACDLQPSELVFAKVPKAETPEVPPTKPPTKVTPPTTETTPSTSTTTVVTTTPSTPTSGTTPPTSSTTTTTGTTETTTTTKTTDTTTTTTTGTTTTTTTPPVSTTTTEKPKDPSEDVPGPTGAEPPPGEPESSAPAEPNPADPTDVPGDEVTDVPAPDATVQPPVEVPDPEPTVAPPPSNPGTNIPDPDAASTTSSTSALGGLAAFTLLLGGVGLRKKLERGTKN